MKFVRKSPVSGKVHTMEIDVSPTEWQKYVNGMNIQQAMPGVNPAHREFIMTGITPEEWDDTFGGDEE